MAGIPRRQGRADPKIGPSDSSDSYADRPDLNTDTDAGGTGERKTVGKVPNAADQKTDRVVTDKEAGLGGGLDQAEEGRLGVTDEELDEKGFRKPKP
jgi:hypothetical protein